MNKKDKEKYEKTRNVKNRDESKKYVLRGERNVRYYDRMIIAESNLSNQSNRNYKK